MLLAGIAAFASEDASVFRFGYAPAEVKPTEVSAQGSGKNYYLESVIRLSPSQSPLVAALKGSKVTGVRCFLRTDYPNPTGKKFSTITYFDGSLTATAHRETKSFVEGWNEFYFSEPIEISDSDLYVGYQVFEVQGNPYPVTSYNKVNIEGSYYANVDRQGFDTYSDKGVLLVEAIIEPAAEPGLCALATATDYPVVVPPSEEFASSIYLRNLSSVPITSATVTVTDSQGNVTDRIDLTLDEPLAPFDGRVIENQTVTLGREEGSDVGATFAVTAINGKEAPLTHPVTNHFFVTPDAFIRVPLVEEFTSMACVNCPFMFYYLEDGLEQFGKQYVYLSRHSGFVEDPFTNDIDRQLAKDFYVSSNPQVMYDRSYLPGKTEILHGALAVGNSDSYLECLELSYNYPALASVNVAVGDSEVNVSGRVSLGESTADGKVFISVYLVEDGIGVEKYPQSGVSYQMADDAPADLKDKFRHNGVVRAALTETATGDRLSFDEDGHYSMNFAHPEMKDSWVKENCHYVAFIHRANPELLKDNYVLNAGDSRPFDHSSITDVKAEATKPLAVYVDATGRIHVTEPVVSAELYNMAGGRLDIAQAHESGIYVVRAVRRDKSVVTVKVRI